MHEDICGRLRFLACVDGIGYSRPRDVCQEHIYAKILLKKSMDVFLGKLIKAECVSYLDNVAAVRSCVCVSLLAEESQCQLGVEENKSQF